MPNLPPSPRNARKPRDRRLNWALRLHGHGLTLAMSRDRSSEVLEISQLPQTDWPSAITRLIMDRADPTSNKRFTAWLVREYAAGRLILEDLGTANETLTFFQRYAPRLGPEQRDIQRYGSLAEAWEVVRSFVERDEVHSNKAQRALERAKAYEESRILHHDEEGFTVAVPLTEFAAQWWGRGTRWCTAAASANAFSYYHQKAPLFVITIPNVGKFQLWANNRSIQFMDEADMPISEVTLNTGRRYFEEIYLFLVMEGVIHYRDFPRALLPKEARSSSQDTRNRRISSPHRLMLAAVTSDTRYLYDLPESLRTEELYIAAVENDRFLLGNMPPHLQTASIVEAAVQKRGQELWHVREDLRTPELWKLALQTHGTMLEIIPEAGRTPELCEIAVRNCAYALQYVPEELRTPELCLLALRHRSLTASLRWIPKQHLTEAVYLEALRAVPQRLQEIPQSVLTEDMIVTALTEDPRLLAGIPFKNRSRRLALAVLSSPNLSKWPDIRGRHISMFSTFYSSEKVDRRLTISPVNMFCRKHLDDEIYRLALQTRHAYFELSFVPRNALTEGLLLLAAKHDPHSETFGDLPKRFQKPEFWKRLLKVNGNLIWRLPKPLLCNEMCEIALQSGAERRMLPEEFRDITIPVLQEAALAEAPSPKAEMRVVQPQAVVSPKIGDLTPHWAAFCERFRASLQKGRELHLKNKLAEEERHTKADGQPLLELRP